MKTKIYILLFYLFAITALPSVRAVKVMLCTKTESSCSKTSNECETGNFVMTLSFNSIQFVKEQLVLLTVHNFEINNKSVFFYVKHFFPSYYGFFWHPPKIVF